MKQPRSHTNPVGRSSITTVRAFKNRRFSSSTKCRNFCPPYPRYAALYLDKSSTLIESINVDDLSRYNAAYRGYGGQKFRHFVEDEKRRFLKALTVVMEDRPTGLVCDLGCFIPYLPLALARLGY